MNDMPLEKKGNPPDKEILGSELETDRRILELHLEINRLRVEMTALKDYMRIASPSFAEQFPHLLEKANRELPSGTH